MKHCFTIGIVMTPKEPYLIRAFHQWILDNNCTPYVVVDTSQPDVMVPDKFIQDGQITLNISPDATGSLLLGDEAIEFNARFGGQPHHLFIPCYAVLAIFAKESGEGTNFAVVPAEQRIELEAQLQDRLKVAGAPVLQAVKTAQDSESGSDEKTKKRKGSHLSVVK